MARLLAEQREVWVILADEPADPEEVTLTETTAGIRAECFFTTNTRMSPTGSAPIDEASLCDVASAQRPATRQWEGTIEVFHDLDPDTGLAVSGGDKVREALDAFNQDVWLLRRRGPLYTEPLAAGDLYTLFKVVMDAEQDPADRAGSFKSVFPVFVHGQWSGTLTTTP